MIKPTPGRVVWYYPGGADPVLTNGKDPLAAIITGVHGDRLVNLVVFEFDGKPVPRTSVHLVQEEDQRPDPGIAFAEWMPYQLGQAKRHADPAT